MLYHYEYHSIFSISLQWVYESEKYLEKYNF